MGMHHEQDMRKMGGLWRKMPITYVTFLIGSLALCAFPPLAGFYSKDTIIEAAQLSTIPGSRYAYFCVLSGAFVTALYTFRSLFMTFHGKTRMDEHTFAHVHESPWVVWLPLVLLAIPSVVIGYLLYMPMLFDKHVMLSDVIFVLPEHNVLEELGKEIISPWHTAIQALSSPVFWLTVLGAVLAAIAYLQLRWLPQSLAERCAWLYRLLLNKYGFDTFNDWFWVRGTKRIGTFFYQIIDQGMIDGTVVNGSGRFVKWLATKTRVVQSGYLYHYVAFMILGLLGFLCWLLLSQ